VTSFLLRCVIFAALLVSVLQLVELAVPFYWGNSGFATKMAYLKESGLRYDTLLVGSSRIFRQADPSIFDAATGRLTNTFNLGVSATYNPEIYYLYEHLLDDDISSDVKFVLMELQSLNRIASRNVATRAAIYSVDRKTCRFAVSTLSEVEVRPAKRAEAVGRYRMSYLQRFFKIHILREILEFRFSPARSDIVLGPNRDGFYALELQVEDAPGRSQAKIALRAALLRSLSARPTCAASSTSSSALGHGESRSVSCCRRAFRSQNSRSCSRSTSDWMKISRSTSQTPGLTRSSTRWTTPSTWDTSLVSPAGTPPCPSPCRV